MTPSGGRCLYLEGPRQGHPEGTPVTDHVEKTQNVQGSSCEFKDALTAQARSGGVRNPDRFGGTEVVLTLTCRRLGSQTRFSLRAAWMVSGRETQASRWGR